MRHLENYTQVDGIIFYFTLHSSSTLNSSLGFATGRTVDLILGFPRNHLAV